MKRTSVDPGSVIAAACIALGIGLFLGYQLGTSGVRMSWAAFHTRSSSALGTESHTEPVTEFNAENEAEKILRNPDGHIKGINMEEFTYREHSCKKYLGEQLVCTACYDHPKRYLGSLTVICNGTDCADVTIPAHLEALGVSLNECFKQD